MRLNGIVTLLALCAAPAFAAAPTAKAPRTPARQAKPAPQQNQQAQQQEAAQRPPAPAIAAADQVKNELDRFKDMYRAIVGYHVLLQGEVSKDTVDAALYDVQHYVDDMQGRYDTNQLFVKDKDALEQMKRTVAKAHLEDSLLNARGVDLERSITEYEKVVELIGSDPADWDTTVERSARLGTLPSATDIAFEVATPREVVEDLKVFWSSGVMARFHIQQYSLPQRANLKLERVGGANDGFSDAAFALAASRFHERAAQGLEEFRIALPAGHYRIAGKDPSVKETQFTIVQNGVPDPIVVNPNTFNFEFASANLNCRPTLYYNGVPVRGLSGLSYGTYRVETPRSCTERLPEKITVDQRNEVTVRTEPDRLDYLREGQPIFLFVTTPPGSTYKLRM